MTSRSIVRIPRSVRRARQWAIQTGSNQTIAIATTPNIFNLQSGLEAELGFNLHNVTASAIRLDIGINFTTGGALGDRVYLHYGVTFVDNVALGIGTTAMPQPESDNADWMAHGSILFANEAAGNSNVPRGGQIKLVSDSMRKQRENNSSLVLLIQASTSLDSVQVFVGGRVLFILP